MLACLRNLLLACAALALLQPRALAAAIEERVVVDANAPAHPFPHFWEHIFGSGRAALSLRERYRDDLRAVHAVTALRYVRFHAIFHDELGVYAENPAGEPIYNFSYVDQIYDGLLSNGVRPFVELSFMPAALADSATQRHSFWYRPIISPPKDDGRWDALITAFARHLIERYGVEEVRQWYFEVWNEPNLDFWSGVPAEGSYFALYEHTARALKKVDGGIRVGGPATAQAAWVPRFIRHCKQRSIPVDFVSTHVYGDDPSAGVFGTSGPLPRREMVCRAAAKVRAEIESSPMPSLPLVLSEFNASYANFRQVTDAPFMGPWLAETVRQCDGLVNEMAYWTFSDVFEEQGVVRGPFHGGFGLVAAGGIQKPSFNAFALLHQLGDQRIAADGVGVLATRRGDGALVVAVWNYAEVGAAAQPRKLVLELKGVSAERASVQALDSQHGNVLAAYASLGEPAYPTAQELSVLRAAAALPEPTHPVLRGHRLQLTIPPDGLVLVTVDDQSNGLER